MGYTCSMSKEGDGMMNSGTFGFSGLGVVRHKVGGSHKSLVLLHAMTADGARLRILCVAMKEALALQAGEKIQQARTLSSIDKLLAKMLTVVVETEKDGGFALQAFGEEDLIPDHMVSAVALRLRYATSLMPEVLDESTGRKYVKRWSDKLRRRAKCGRMLKALGRRFPEGGLPDGDAFDAFYDEVEAAFEREQAEDTLLPSARQIDFARRMAKAFGEDLGFDLNTASRSQVSAYISANKDRYLQAQGT